MAAITVEQMVLYGVDLYRIYFSIEIHIMKIIIQDEKIYMYRYIRLLLTRLGLYLVRKGIFYNKNSYFISTIFTWSFMCRRILRSSTSSWTISCSNEHEHSQYNIQR